MGIRDVNKVYTTDELATGKSLVFAACGVTDGNLLQGRPLHRRRHAHALGGDDVHAGAGPVHRNDAPGKQAGRKGAVPVAADC